jgi:uncharacterized membrane protein
MLFTWNTENLCIIFRWWHIRSTPGLIFSLLAVVAVTAAYEALRAASRNYESWAVKKQDEVPSKLPSCLSIFSLCHYHYPYLLRPLPLPRPGHT